MMNEEELREFVAKLPEHLRFFFQEPPQELEHGEFIEFMRARLAKVREHLEEFQAHGVAAERFLAEVEPKLEDLAQAQKSVEQHEDVLLNARADLADKEYDLFKLMQQAVRETEEHNPFHPDLPEWREQLEELAKQFSKE